METATVTMSATELERLHWMRALVERRATQRLAATELGLSVRQVQRLRDAYVAGGSAALASERRGKPSNRSLPSDMRELVLSIVRTRYAGFGPTLAREKLVELHDIAPSLETLRVWMTAAGLWETRKERRKRPQQPRRRRACVGELIQIDGSDHEWFEDRGPRCTLLVYVDDATSRLMELRFTRSESTFDYFAATTTYLRAHGKPVAFYSDKASIFRVNKSDVKAGNGYTQFGRAMHDLNIDVICANSPAAKGRVERANQTLQDRLVKELRLRGISDRDAGNAFLPAFMADYNRRFERAPANQHDAHRPMLAHEDPARIFTWQEERRLTDNLTLHYKRVLYLVDVSAAAESARGKRVLVVENEDGAVHIEYGGVTLQAHAFPKDARVSQAAIVDNKALAGALIAIQAQQRERDRHTLNTRKLTLREEDHLRKSMGEPGLVHRRADHPEALEPPPAIAAVAAPLLAHALAWAKDFSAAPPPRRRTTNAR
jgi:transposase